MAVCAVPRPAVGAAVSVRVYRQQGGIATTVRACVAAFDRNGVVVHTADDAAAGAVAAQSQASAAIAARFRTADLVSSSGEYRNRVRCVVRCRPYEAGGTPASSSWCRGALRLASLFCDCMCECAADETQSRTTPSLRTS